MPVSLTPSHFRQVQDVFFLHILCVMMSPDDSPKKVGILCRLCGSQKIKVLWRHKSEGNSETSSHTHTQEKGGSKRGMPKVGEILVNYWRYMYIRMHKFQIIYRYVG